MISHVRLRHFRNYNALSLDLSPGLTLVTGGNGQGKTNLLEALHYLALLRSFRTRQIRRLQQWGADYFHLDGVTAGSSPLTRTKLTVTYAQQRRLRVDGKLVRKASDFIGRILCVACAPEDLGVIKGPPDERRRFVDMLLCQRNSLYLDALIRYNTALKSRNILLKNPAQRTGKILSAYDRILSDYGSRLIGMRRKFAAEFNPIVESTGQLLFGHRGRLSFRYAPNAVSAGNAGNGSGPDELAAVLRESFQRDCEQGRTARGPHRDDYTVLLDNVQLREFGSEGQCRTASLCLKLGSVELLRQEAGKPLVLLVDDVLGELDDTHRGLFFGNFAKATQVIMACTEPPAELRQKAAAKWRVNNGELSSEA